MNRATEQFATAGDSTRLRWDEGQSIGEAFAVGRWKHPNGLTVVLCPDSSCPLVASQIWYRVGSANETRGQTGIAHLFEHLMFNRTSQRDTGEFDRCIEEVGGDCNAATWVDWTSYSITIPATELELALGLEADRMCNLILDEDVLEAERDVVLNERLERVDDDIGGQIDELLAKTAFRSHPYGIPTIGFADDIRGLSLEGIRTFYERYYGPQNAVVVVAGGIEIEQTLQLVDRLFGDITPGVVASRQLAAEPTQREHRQRHLHHDSDTARVVCGYRIPGQAHPDWAALCALAGLLCGGPSARLSQRLVTERELAIYVDCDAMPFRDPGLFRIAIGGTVGVTPTELETATAEIIDSIANEPISEIEMEKVHSGTETDFWLELETADGKADALGHYETTHGDVGALFETAKALASVTADDLQRVAATYLVAEAKTTVTCGSGAEEK